MSPRSVDITALVRVFSLSGAMSWTLSLAMMISCKINGALVAAAGPAVDFNSRSILAPDERREFGDQIVVELALEGHDQARQLLQIGPPPGREFGMLGRDVDVAVGTEEAEGEPFLALSPEPAFPELRHQFRRQVIAQPIAAFADEARAVGADLLAHLAPGGL